MEKLTNEALVTPTPGFLKFPWWRHQMKTFSALLAICAGNSPVTGEFLAQRPVTRSFDVFFDLRPNKRLSKQSRGWLFLDQILSQNLSANIKTNTHWINILKAWAKWSSWWWRHFQTYFLDRMFCILIQKSQSFVPWSLMAIYKYWSRWLYNVKWARSINLNQWLNVLTPSYESFLQCYWLNYNWWNVFGPMAISSICNPVI